MSSDISSCYKVGGAASSQTMSTLDIVLQVDQSWANSTLLDVLTFVPDFEECRALCRVLMIINKDDIYNPP